MEIFQFPTYVLKRLPTIGIVVFILLYVLATSRYPGGSPIDPESVGFDWMNNYWCNLLNEKGMNGMENPARPIAITALFILCSSILFFFFQVTEHFLMSRTWKLLVRVSAVLSMVTAAFIFTDLHDEMTIVSSLFGVMVVFGVLRGLLREGELIFKLGGAICLVLLVINNLIYYTGIYIAHLPFLQKVSMLLVFIWVIGLNLIMSSRLELSSVSSA